jgi:hypothetical protein
VGKLTCSLSWEKLEVTLSNVFIAAVLHDDNPQLVRSLIEQSSIHLNDQHEHVISPESLVVDEEDMNELVGQVQGGENTGAHYASDYVKRLLSTLTLKVENLTFRLYTQSNIMESLLSLDLEIPHILIVDALMSNVKGMNAMENKKIEVGEVKCVTFPSLEVSVNSYPEISASQCYELFNLKSTTKTVIASLSSPPSPLSHHRINSDVTLQNVRIQMQNFLAKSSLSILDFCSQYRICAVRFQNWLSSDITDWVSALTAYHFLSKRDEPNFSTSTNSTSLLDTVKTQLPDFLSPLKHLFNFEPQSQPPYQRNLDLNILYVRLPKSNENCVRTSPTIHASLLDLEFLVGNQQFGFLIEVIQKFMRSFVRSSATPKPIPEKIPKKPVLIEPHEVEKDQNVEDLNIDEILKFQKRTMEKEEERENTFQNQMKETEFGMKSFHLNEDNVVFQSMIGINNADGEEELTAEDLKKMGFLPEPEMPIAQSNLITNSDPLTNSDLISNSDIFNSDLLTVEQEEMNNLFYSMIGLADTRTVGQEKEGVPEMIVHLRRVRIVDLVRCDVVEAAIGEEEEIIFEIGGLEFNVWPPDNDKHKMRISVVNLGIFETAKESIVLGDTKSMMKIKPVIQFKKDSQQAHDLTIDLEVTRSSGTQVIAKFDELSVSLDPTTLTRIQRAIRTLTVLLNPSTFQSHESPFDSPMNPEGTTTSSSSGQDEDIMTRHLFEFQTSKVVLNVFQIYESVMKGIFVEVPDSISVQIDGNVKGSCVVTSSNFGFDLSFDQLKGSLGSVELISVFSSKDVNVSS